MARKIYIKIQIKLVLILVILGCFCRVSTGEQLFQAPAAMHISSTVSDGKLGIDEIVKTARQNDIKIVILTDRDFMRWEYGLWPLRRLIKKTIGTNSVATYGIKNYLKEIEEIQKRNPDLVIIPGVESAPFYYWKGSPFKDNLEIHNWHKHILVIGLENVDDYKYLPSVSNRHRLALPFRFQDTCHLWPILILIVGILCLVKRKFKYKDLRGHPLGPYSHNWQVCGIILMIFSLAFLLNNLPFQGFKYDQYHGEQGVGPYQTLIDYVNSKGGLTFWAHPEAEYIGKRGQVSIETREHAYHLLEAHDYTGFAIFYEGYKEIGHPGGIWDEVLKQYCEGRRNSPVWAIAGLAFDQRGNLAEYMQYLRTIFLIPHLTKQAALKALEDGKMYVVRGKTGLVLDDFIVQGSLPTINGTIGDEIDSDGNPAVKISGHFANGRSETIKISLIRNGAITKIFEVVSPFEVNYQDDYFDQGKKIYYRIEIHYPGGILVTNPIFVKFKH